MQAPMMLVLVATLVFAASAKPYVPEHFTAAATSEPSAHQAMPAQAPLLRRYTSAQGASGVSSGVSPTPPTAAPTSAPAGSAVTITQTVEATVTGGAAAYTGSIKSLYEKTYANVIGLMEADKVTYKAGCEVKSTAVNARRSTKVAISYEAKVAAAQAAVAQSKTATGGFDAAAFTTAFAATKTEMAKTDATVAAIPTPTVSKVSAGTTTVVLSGASKTSVSFAAATVALAALALFH